MAASNKNEPVLFGKESQVLQRIESILAKARENEQLPLLDEYRFLSEQYESLLKISIKLTKVSDATQRKLMHAKDEIDRRTQELKEKNQTLYHTSVTDHLTGVFNRMYLMDVFLREFARSQRNNLPLSCAILDIDKFKDFNDSYGHLTGDIVLKETASLIGEQVRKQDVFGRYGGEEFMLILPGTADESARLVAEKIRERVASTTYPIDGNLLKVTLSIGVADLDHGEPPDVDALIRNADLALYDAKRLGRNRVISFSGIT